MKPERRIPIMVLLALAAIFCFAKAGIHGNNVIQVYRVTQPSSSQDTAISSETIREEKNLSQFINASESDDTVFSSISPSLEGPSSSTHISSETSLSGNDKIDLNAATEEELQKLPGIGPVLAGRIVTYREEHRGFLSVEEIKDVSGIGDKIYAKIEPYLFVK